MEGGEEEANAEKEGSNPMLVMWDSRAKGPHAHLLPAKIDYDLAEAAAQMVAPDLVEKGYTRVIFRSDGEASLLAFMRRVGQLWGGEIVP